MSMLPYAWKCVNCSWYGGAMTPIYDGKACPGCKEKTLVMV